MQMRELKIIEKDLANATSELRHAQCLMMPTAALRQRVRKLERERKAVAKSTINRVG